MFTKSALNVDEIFYDLTLQLLLQKLPVVRPLTVPNVVTPRIYTIVLWLSLWMISMTNWMPYLFLPMRVVTITVFTVKTLFGVAPPPPYCDPGQAETTSLWSGDTQQARAVHPVPKRPTLRLLEQSSVLKVPCPTRHMGKSTMPT